MRFSCANCSGFQPIVIKEWTFLVLSGAFFAISDDRPAFKTVMECDEWNPTHRDDPQYLYAAA